MGCRTKPLTLAACYGALAVCALTPLAASGDQIVVVTDGHGHKVYINTGDLPAGYKRSGNAHGEALTVPPPEVQALVKDTSQRHQVDPELIHAIIQVESAYNPKAVSSKGAMGLMQLIPATADRFGVENPFNAKQNIEGGVSYLRYLLNLFGGDLDLSLAAYNAGEHRVLGTKAVPSIAETREYVKKVEKLYRPGSSHAEAKKSAQAPPKAHIYRYVDGRGIVHITNGDEL